MKHKHPKKLFRTKTGLGLAGACLGIIVSGGATAQAQTTDSDKITALEKQNQDLQQRLGALEDMAKQQGILPSGQAPKFVSSMADMTISGFVQASR